MEQKKLLITGFDPFGGENINPSWEAVKLLPDIVGDYVLTKIQIPTVFDKAVKVVLQEAEKIIPNAIICVGQAGGRNAITPEVVGINLKEANIPDNEGNMPINECIKNGGDVAYFSSLPVRKIVQKVKEAGIPCALSYSAGAFVCNNVLYSLLDNYRDTNVQVGFIHVPFLPEQAKENQPSLPLQKIAEGLKIAISVL